MRRRLSPDPGPVEILLIMLLSAIIYIASFCAAYTPPNILHQSGSRSGSRTPRSSSRSSLSQRQIKPVIPSVSTTYLDRDVIMAGRSVYTKFGLPEILNTRFPSESLIKEKIPFLTPLGEKDEFKFYSESSTGTVQTPLEGMPGFLITWNARIQRCDDPSKNYKYNLEARYIMRRRNSSRQISGRRTPGSSRSSRGASRRNSYCNSPQNFDSVMFSESSAESMLISETEEESEYDPQLEAIMKEFDDDNDNRRKVYRLISVEIYISD